MASLYRGFLILGQEDKGGSVNFFGDSHPGPIPHHSVRGSLGQIREIRVCRSNGGEITNIKELRSVNMYSVNNTMNPVGRSLDRFD